MRTRAIVAVLVAALAAHVHGAWTHSTSHDDFEGITRVVAASTVFGSPYRSASLTVRCDQKGDDRDIHVYFTFGYLNLAGGDPTRLRVKFDDDEPKNWKVQGMSVSRSGVFMDDAVRLAESLAEAETFAVRMTYYKEGPITIRFAGDGAAEAIGAVFGSECGAHVAERRGTVARMAERRRAEEVNWTAAAPQCSQFIPTWSSIVSDAEVRDAVEQWKACMKRKGATPCYPSLACRGHAHSPESPRGFAGLYACRDACLGKAKPWNCDMVPRDEESRAAWLEACRTDEEDAGR